MSILAGALSRKVSTGHQILVYIMFSVISISYLLLNDIDTDQAFKGNLIFYLMLIGSALFLFMISFTNIGQRKLKGDRADLFFFQDISISKFLIWVPIGILASFGIALLSQNLGLGSIGASIVSIAGSGLIMMVIFFIVKSILPSIIIHASFNTIVIALRDGIIASDFVGLELVPIPNIAISFGQVNQFLTDVMVQYTLVAPAEEMLKMLILAFVVLGIPNARFKSGISKYIGATIALVVWSSFHLIQAITN